jgi:hypothetical protein
MRLRGRREIGWVSESSTNNMFQLFQPTEMGSDKESIGAKWCKAPELFTPSGLPVWQY